MKTEDALGNLRHALECGRLAHSYIVIGAPRIEGLSMAEGLLGLLFCSGRTKPCGSCRGCSQVADRTHPDIVWVEPQKKSRIISIEQVRDLQEQIYKTSYLGGWKACVFVGADRMGDQAQNAFLKTLEEPPGRCIFLLLTDSPQHLLPTVISRCQSVNVESGKLGIPDEWRSRVVEILSRDVSVIPGKKSVIAAFGVGAALKRFLREIEAVIEKEESEIAEDEATDESKDTIKARVSSRYREARTAIIRAILLWHRDILVLVCGADKGLVFGGDCLEVLRSKAARLDVRLALMNVRFVEEMQRQLDRHIPDATVLDFGFSRMN